MDYGEQDFIPCERCYDKIVNGYHILKRAVDIHHIKYRSSVGSDEWENLIALCRECHNEVHNKNIDKEIVFSWKKQPGFADKEIAKQF